LYILIANVYHALLENNDIRKKKFADNRLFSIAIFIIFGFVGPVMWIWDYVTDPIGAKDTIMLRLIFLLLFLVALIFKYISNLRSLLIITVLAILTIEIVFVDILNHLDGGMTYGIGGFIYFLLAEIMCFQGFSLVYGLLMLFFTALLPHLLGIIGFAENFQHSHYAALIWPATFIAMLLQTILSLNYLRRYRLEQQLELLSNTDPMTDAYNRRYFYNVGESIFLKNKRKNTPIIVAMLDIDNFKNINDEYGHNAGDIGIKEVSKILSKYLRESDLFARFGGEEFCILLEDISLEDAKKLFERVRESFEKNTFKYNDIEINYTVSIGVAFGMADSLEDMVRLSDNALYYSKNNGKNRCTFKLVHIG